MLSVSSLGVTSPVGLNFQVGEVPHGTAEKHCEDRWRVDRRDNYFNALQIARTVA